MAVLGDSYYQSSLAFPATPAQVSTYVPASVIAELPWLQSHISGDYTSPPGDDGSGVPGKTYPQGPAAGQIWPRDRTVVEDKMEVRDEGTLLTKRTTLNFVGPGVTATDDAANARTVVTIPGAAAAPARQTATITTASLANDAQETGTVTLSKSYRLLKLETNVAARIRLYSTTAKRDADLARPAGTDPTGDHGLMFDFVTTTGALVADISPTVDGFDGKATPDGLIPYTITNLSGSTRTVTATLTWISTE